MAVVPGSILVAETTAGKKLDTVEVVTSEGTVEREGVFIGDPQFPSNRASVSTAGELSIIGLVNAAITSSISLSIANFPATQVVSGTVSVSSGSVGLTSDGSTKLVGQITVANPTTSVTISNPTTAVTVNVSTAVDATLTSAGSTRLVGQVTVANPTTAVNVANPTTSVNIANPTTSVTVTNPTTVVDLSSNGSTRLVGQFTVANPTTAVTVNTSTSVTITNPTTLVTVTSGVVLAAGSSANTIGSAALVAGTSANTIGSVALVAGTTANALGSVALLNGTTANSIGGVALLNGTTGNSIGSVALLAGTSANIVGAVALTSGFNTIGNLQKPSTATLTQIAFTTADTTAVSANSARLGLWLFNDNQQVVYIGLSTAVLSTLSYSFQLGSSAGFQFPVPCYTGAVHCKWAATASTVGSLRVTELTS